MIGKKVFRLLAGASVCATLPALASAQSSITLYGRVDAGIEYVSGLPTGASQTGSPTGSGSRFGVQSGDGGISMLGLRGSEDIGGGTSIQFHLENQYLLTNGTLAGNGFWNRFSTIAVANDSFGTLTIGHQLFISNAVWDFDPFGQSLWASASLVRGRNWPEANNAVQYDSPKIGGFSFSGQYAFSNATSWNGNGTTSDGRNAGAYVTYTNSTVQLRAMYDETRDPANGRFDDVFLYSREYTMAANVFLGPVKLQATYQASRTSGVTAASGNPTTTNFVWGGASWQISDPLSVQAAVYHINANNDGGNATLYAVGGTYALSKRTLLKAQVATVRNSRTANFSLNPNDPAGDSVASGNPSRGHSQTGAFVGIQHYF